VVTALAPVLWGTTYLTTTALLPPNHPFLTGAMGCLPVGLGITLLCRRLPHGAWWWRTGVVGTLYFGLCFALFFSGVYRLPGGVAATISAIQPLLVAMIAWPLLGLRPERLAICAGLAGVVGVGMLVLGGAAQLDAVGVFATAGGSVSMSFGTVLIKRWGCPSGVSVLAFTGWQLVVGGLLLTPLALLFEGLPRAFTFQNGAGYAYFCVCLMGFAYTIWFRGIERLPASSVTFLVLLTPIVASLAGFVYYHQSFTLTQLAGMAVVGACVLIAQRSGRPDVRQTPVPQAGPAGVVAM
jgi:probable blue pigment (indigoidine) exporter